MKTRKLMIVMFVNGQELSACTRCIKVDEKANTVTVRYAISNDGEEYCEDVYPMHMIAKLKYSVTNNDKE